MSYLSNIFTNKLNRLSEIFYAYFMSSKAIHEHLEAQYLSSIMSRVIVNVTAVLTYI